MEELQGVYAWWNDQAKCYKVWIFKAKNKVAQNESKVKKLWVFLYFKNMSSISNAIWKS